MLRLRFERYRCLLKVRVDPYVDGEPMTPTAVSIVVQYLVRDAYRAATTIPQYEYRRAKRETGAREITRGPSCYRVKRETGM